VCTQILPFCSTSRRFWKVQKSLSYIVASFGCRFWDWPRLKVADLLPKKFVALGLPCYQNCTVKSVNTTQLFLLQELQRHWLQFGVQDVWSQPSRSRLLPQQWFQMHTLGLRSTTISVLLFDSQGQECRRRDNDTQMWQRSSRTTWASHFRPTIWRRFLLVYMGQRAPQQQAKRDSTTF